MVDVDQLRGDLLAARKARDDVAVAALRRAMAALENAAAPPALAYGSGGPTEVARLHLDDEQRRALIQRELDEAESAAADYDAGGQSEAAQRLRAECDVLRRYL